MSKQSSAKKSLEKGSKYQEPEVDIEDKNDVLIGEEPVEDQVSNDDNEEIVDDENDLNNEEEVEDGESGDGAEIDDDVDENDLEFYAGDEDVADIANQTKEEKLRKIKEFNEKQARKGIVYLSRIPPFMKASQIKKHFWQYGVTKVYLTPEEDAKRKFRQKQGGNRRRKYTEGWIEFKDKKNAKFVAAAFNNQQLGGKKGNYYAEDIWNIRYLPKFKWENLTEKMNYDRKMRKEKLQTELSMAKKTHDYYLDQVDKSKKIMAIKNYKDSKRKALDDIDEVMDSAHQQPKKKDQSMKSSGEDDKDRIRRLFKQKKPKVAADQ